MKIGIDLGGTKTEAIVIDLHGNEVFRKRIKTEKNYEGTIKGIRFLVDEIESRYSNIESIGIGMPGAVSEDSSLVKNANSIWLNNKPLKKDLESSLKKNINLENDANCFALSEAVDGAGKDFKLVFGVIIGTGVGGGLIYDRKIIQGKNKITGEWGHTPLPNISIEEKKYAKDCIKIKRSYPDAYYELGLSEKGLNNRIAAIEAFKSAKKSSKWRKIAQYEIDLIKKELD